MMWVPVSSHRLPQSETTGASLHVLGQQICGPDLLLPDELQLSGLLLRLPDKMWDVEWSSMISWWSFVYLSRPEVTSAGLFFTSSEETPKSWKVVFFLKRQLLVWWKEGRKEGRNKERGKERKKERKRREERKKEWERMKGRKTKERKKKHDTGMKDRGERRRMKDKMERSNNKRRQNIDWWVSWKSVEKTGKKWRRKGKTG